MLSLAQSPASPALSTASLPDLQASPLRGTLPDLSRIQRSEMLCALIERLSSSAPLEHHGSLRASLQFAALHTAESLSWLSHGVDAFRAGKLSLLHFAPMAAAVRLVHARRNLTADEGGAEVGTGSADLSEILDSAIEDLNRAATEFSEARKICAAEPQAAVAHFAAVDARLSETACRLLDCFCVPRVV